jgi:hypothetical protein
MGTKIAKISCTWTRLRPGWLIGRYLPVALGCACSSPGEVAEPREHIARDALPLIVPQTGSKPFAVLRCRYPDDTTPAADIPTNQQYQQLIQTAFNLWSAASYNTMTMSGTVRPTCSGSPCTAWYTLPRPKSAYANDFFLYANDCLGAADAQVNFSQFYGVAIGAIGGFYTNGALLMQLGPPRDGVTQIPLAIVESVGAPPFTIAPGYLAHELGHTLGLPHVNPDPIFPVTLGPTFDILASGGMTNTNMYHKDRLGWIPAARRYVATPGSNTTLTLERSAQPPNAAGTFLLAQIPIPGTGPVSGTGASVMVEARRKVGNDASIASEGVLISYVDPTEMALNGQKVPRGRPVYFWDPDDDSDVNEQSSFLTAGQTHTNSRIGLTLQVLQQTTSGYQVSIAYSPPACTGDGFRAEYFNNQDLTDSKVTRVDPFINFDFGVGSPDPSIDGDTFSARWEGRLVAPVTGAYTFHADTDDGVRLWINNQLVIDQWINRCCDTLDVVVTLQAGQTYPIKMEYFDNNGFAVAKLTWTPPNFFTLPVSTIPSCLVSSSVTANQPPSTNITSPASGATFTAPANITINANANDSDGTISKVEFYQGTTLLGTDMTSPYSFGWTNVAAGNYSLTSKAYDNLNATGTSTPVPITVNGGCTLPAAPATPRATAGKGQATLSWSAVSGATSYTLRRSTTTGGPFTDVAPSLAGTSTVNAGLTNGTTYFYVVAAVNGCGTGPNSTQVSATPDASLLLHYLFNETSGTTASDSSGNGHSATLSGATFVSGGHNGNCVDINGGTQRVNLPANVVQSCTDITFAARVRLDTNGSNWARIFDIGTGTATNLFLTPRGGASNVLRFGFKLNNAAEQQISATFAFPTVTWKHVAVTLSGNTGRLYLDGAQVAQNTSLTNNPNSMGATANNFLGDSNYSADPTLDGRLDDFRISCRAYSAAEVAALFP